MKRPGKLGTTLLAIFLIGVGALPILQLNWKPAYAILHIIAVAAGVFIWLDR